MNWKFWKKKQVKPFDDWGSPELIARAKKLQAEYLGATKYTDKKVSKAMIHQREKNFMFMRIAQLQLEVEKLKSQQQ